MQPRSSPGGTATETQHLEEWKVARETIQNFDERLHDLRKYGFSFLTALLAAEAVLIPGPIKATFAQPGVPPIVLFAVLFDTFLMILALRLLDRSYVLFIIAIAQRAKVLERTLNLELTEVIAQRHADDRIDLYVRALYGALNMAVGVLGAALFAPDLNLSGGMIVVSLVVAVLVDVVGNLQPTRGPRGVVDWILGRTECVPGDAVNITVTNLLEKDPPLAIELEPGEYGWVVRVRDGEKVARLKVHAKAPFPAQGNHTFVWNVPERDSEGVYIVFAHAAKKLPGPWTLYPAPLRRSIVVGKKKAERPAQEKPTAE